MENIQADAVGAGGYVRAVFSRRVRGFAAPVDLMRVCLRAKRAAAERARVRGAFAGYLVTEPGPVVWSDRRWRHRMNSTWMAGDFSSSYELQDWAADEGCGAIDAPPAIAAGSCVLLSLVNGFRFSCSSVVRRGGK